MRHETVKSAAVGDVLVFSCRRHRHGNRICHLLLVMHQRHLVTEQAKGVTAVSQLCDDVSHVMSTMCQTAIGKQMKMDAAVGQLTADGQQRGALPFNGRWLHSTV